MNSRNKIKNDAPDLVLENISEPARIALKKRVNIVVFLIAVFAGLAVLTSGLYGLYTGSLLTIDKLTLLYNKILAASIKDLVPPLVLFCAALFFLIYSVYGVRRGWLRDIVPMGRGGGSRDRTRYQGLPMWLMFFSYLSLSVYLIANAITFIYEDTHGYVPRYAWKWKDAHNLPLFLWLALVIIAGILDSYIGGRDKRDVLAGLRERFGKDSEGKKALLDKGITYDRKTFFEYIAENDVKVVKLFLDAGMNVDGVDPLEMYTPLSSAARHGHKEQVKLFLERKADINKAPRGQLPPVWQNLNDIDDISILRLLVKNGADISMKSADGETVLMRAASNLYLDAVELLVQNKADINAQADDGHTALVYAVERTRYEDEDGKKVVEPETYNIVKYLLEHGADPNVKLIETESKNNTPLRIARSSRKVKEVVELLEKYHAKE